MNNEPLITIIVPVYNAEHSLEKCVQSILQQKYRNLEILLINDGSTDSSLAICNKLQKVDSRVKVTDKENEKVSKTRNKGIELAKGEYICFVDSDDYVSCDFVTKLYENIKGYDLCTCNYYINTNINSNIKDFEVENKTMYMYIENMQRDFLFHPLWNKIYKTSIIKENNIKFENGIQVGEDYLFNIQYIKNIQKAKYISEPLYYYGVYENSLTRKYIKRDLKKEMTIVRELKKFYKQNSFDLKYVYNQYIELFKTNIINLQKEIKDKQVNEQFINEFILELNENKIIERNIRVQLSTENKVLHILMQKKYINLIYYYFIMRDKIKMILKK